MSKIVLITGITGQDGSYLAELLLKKDYEVHGLVRADFSEKDNLKSWRIKKILKNITFHKMSIESYDDLFKSIKKIKPVEVYHLAAQAKDGYSFDNEFYTFRINLNATHYILSSVRKINDKTKFFFAGSSEMFNDEENVPINEKTLFNPKSAYGIAKVASHYLIKNYRENFKMHAATGILFNHESPRRGKTFVTRKITRGVAQILAGKIDKISLGNLKAKRDWGYAKDYVKAMWLMLQQPEPDDYVVASGESHTVQEFLEEAFSLVGLDWEKHIEIDSKYFRPSEVDVTKGDATKARPVLGWHNETSFKKLVHLMLESDLEREGLQLANYV